MTEDGLFLNGYEVRDFILKNFNWRQVYVDKGDSYISTMIEKLRIAANKARTEEQAFYSKLNEVKSIQDLQAKIDEFNNDAAIQSLTARGLREMDWFNKLAQENESTAEIISDMALKIKETSWLKMGQFVNGLVKGMKQYFEQGKDIRLVDVNGGKTLINEANLKKALTDALKGKSKLSKTYARDLKTYLRSGEVVRVGPNEEKIDFTLQAPSFPTSLPVEVKGFPYYNLTPADRALANENNPVSNYIWESFQDYMSNGSRYENEIKKAMNDLMGRKAFINSGGSIGDVIGIIGELHAMVFFLVFTGKTNPRYTGHDLTESGKKLSVDIALEAFGIQVKNYKGYEGENGKGYNLNETLTWKQLDDRKVYPLDSIEHYYVTQAFNKPNYSYKNLDTFKEYVSFYNNFLNQKNGSANNLINALFASNIEKLIPLETSEEMGGIEAMDSFKPGSVFWLFGGKTIIPSSAILEALRARLTEFREQLVMKNKTTFNNFRVNVSGSYHGKKWDNFKKAPDGVTYNKILEELNGIRFNLNIYLPDIQQYM